MVSASIRIQPLRKMQACKLPSILNKSEETIKSAYNFFTGSTKIDIDSDASDWFQDNYYIVQQTIRQIRKDLPVDFYRRLPLLPESPHSDPTRIFSVCSEILKKNELIDMHQAKRFLKVYQKKIPLTTGEIWAIPPMMRLCILLKLTDSLKCIMKDEYSDEEVSSCILNLRFINELDWKEFFEKVSTVESILLEDPSGIYPEMDFDTRNSYRNVIEDTSRHSGIPENEIASLVVKLALKGCDDPVSHHIGFFLRTTDGLKILRDAAGYTRHHFFNSYGWKLFFYLGGIALLTLFIAGYLALYAFSAGAQIALGVAVFLLSVLPASTLGVDLINNIILHTISPMKLPRMSFKRGIPSQCRTLVVVPCLLGSQEETRVLLKQLEQHYLGNPDRNLFFALLSDFTDSPTENTPEDNNLLEYAVNGIKHLNREYRRRSGNIFHLFHRKRLWNQAENCWMGWERKRGKLMELNRMLLNKGSTSFIIGKNPGDIRYVITLDSDTILPGGSAVRLAATMAHPLNQYTKDRGYSILQPRILTSSPEGESSVFLKVYPGEFSVDLYSNAVSDVYQDLFNQGSYVGKGIYDLDAFENSLDGKVPPESLLSHDLFEGMQGRAGLVSDIILYEDFPPNYNAWIHRLHRWIRGDWQLFPWLMSKVRDESCKKVKNNFSCLARWKILDNMRRSLVEPALLIFIVSTWFILPGSKVFWTLASMVIIFRYPLIQVLVRPADFFRRPQGIHWLRSLLGLVFLPWETLFKLHAIGVSLIRLLITRKNLLEWTTAAKSSRTYSSIAERVRAWKRMRIMLILVPAMFSVILLTASKAVWIATPFLVIWLLSPGIEYITNRSPRIKIPVSLEVKKAKLRKIAIRTWNFFDTFVGPEDHWLPPDHYQEDPLGTVAHRTSPTNIGLLLLTVISARDMGYIGLQDCILRLSNTLSNMKQLDRYRGHLLNWYDTRTLKPLSPRYVSTVDSGNLSCCLLTAARSCMEMADSARIDENRWLPLVDIVDILIDVLEEMDIQTTELTANLRFIRETVLNKMCDHEACLHLLVDLCRNQLSFTEELLMEVVDRSIASVEESTIAELRTWSSRMRLHLSEMLREVEEFFPWMLHLCNPPDILATAEPSDGVAQAWLQLNESLPSCPSPIEMITAAGRAGEKLVHLRTVLDDLPPSEDKTEAIEWCARLKSLLELSLVLSNETIEDLKELESSIRSEFLKMGFSFLYSKKRKVFHIGYNLESEHNDSNYYDLLASEARLASLIAIARGDVPQEHWLHLSRALTVVSGMKGLLSWSGTMFEYLMPLLLTGFRKETLLGQSCLTAVKHQINYGRRLKQPWGISESGYYRFDQGNHYQYRAFGIPGLGYKRGLEEDSVVAPYASLLALSLLPDEVIQNSDKLTSMGFMGRYGFFEAGDFTPSRLPNGNSYMIVRSYMAHHQGMIMLSITNFLCEETMVERFFSEPIIKVVKLLLQEQFPFKPPILYPRPQQSTESTERKLHTELIPWAVSGEYPAPRVHYLSNGRYRELITDSGGGFTQWNNLNLTRWSGDTTLDNTGTWIYLKDLDSGFLWSLTKRPVGSVSLDRRIQFFPHKVEFTGEDQGISASMEIIVDPEEDAGIRRIEIRNISTERKNIFICSYSEIVLASLNESSRHPAFNKLFIASEYLKEIGVLMFHRRKRKSDEKSVFLGHALIGSPVSCYETDRLHFLGRGGTCVFPKALSGTAPWLSCTSGEMIDPVMSLGTELELPPDGNTVLYFVTFCASDSSGIQHLAEKYADSDTLESLYSQSEIVCRKNLFSSEITCSDIEKSQPVLSALFYPSAALRASSEVLETNTLGQRDLWRFGISGDNPLLLVSIDIDESTDILHRILQIHSFWRKQGLTVDLVILNEEESGYEPELQGKLNRLLNLTGSDKFLNIRGGVFLLRTDQITEEELVLLKTWSRVYLNCETTLEKQFEAVPERPVRLPEFVPIRNRVKEPAPPLIKPDNLLFYNGTGGFSADGREYIIYLTDKEWTPAPWINVISNPFVGFIASDTGFGCTWAINSGENRLSPWNNDPVSETPGEVLYLRDEETGDFWSPSPLPVRESDPYLIRHGAGYSSWEHNSHGLKQKMTAFVLQDKPLKGVNLNLRNTGKQNRRISITFYIEPVLGTERIQTQQFIVSEFNSPCNAIFAFNSTRKQLAGGGVFFLASSRTPNGLTTDRTEFLGRSGGYSNPAALHRTGLSGTILSGLDSCMAMQVIIWIGPDEQKEVTFLMGQGREREECTSLIRENMVEVQDGTSLHKVTGMWNRLLNRISVDTPDPAMNTMLNHWLLYQTLSCRILGRSAFYQSSGAFGFRDQLQDCMALCNTAPEIFREHILKSASMQFNEGDVLHWWHPPGTVGVRTRCSDDLLWLPYATSVYVHNTGDMSILDEIVPYLKGETLKENENERYAEYLISDKSESLHIHCLRALKKGSTCGIHGLPLMGSHDWNDGMSSVGIQGKGESVWLGWFLYDTLQRYAKVCRDTGDSEGMNNCLSRAEILKYALDENSWDGKWFLRGFYDDGSLLGSSTCDECRIDSIAQSWATLSGGGNSSRALEALDSVLAFLLDSKNKLLLLFDPPFDKSTQNPGYIKGYPPGIRENGGQYTHASTWVAWAFAMQGRGDTAESIFRLLNPIYHSDSPGRRDKYCVEPYVVAADIYSSESCMGKGGWTWYTGAAGWLYRLGIEMILGITTEGNNLVIDPCIPSHWKEFKAIFRRGEGTYNITVVNPEGVCKGVTSVTLDNRELVTGSITIDERIHEVLITMGLP